AGRPTPSGAGGPAADARGWPCSWPGLVLVLAGRLHGKQFLRHVVVRRHLGQAEAKGIDIGCLGRVASLADGPLALVASAEGDALPGAGQLLQVGPLLAADVLLALDEG